MQPNLSPVMTYEKDEIVSGSHKRCSFRYSSGRIFSTTGCMEVKCGAEAVFGTAGGMIDIVTGDGAVPYAEAG